MSGSVHHVIPVRNFKCFPEDPLQIRIIDNNEGSFFNNYSLVATISHSGSLNNGNYWAVVKDDTTNCWFPCNDKVVFEIKAGDINNKNIICTLLYEKMT